MKRETFVILHDIRSALNVGSIFRTADATGVKKLFLTGYTPSPLDRFDRKRKDIEKTALGAEENVEWSSEENIEVVINRLRKQGYSITAVEQHQKSVDYRAIPSAEKQVFIFGNETEGLSESIMSLCDRSVFIPMYGKKESLNVSVSVGVILYHNIQEQKV
jgi:23S rRNA (guanosine2251-2'-O)-methyltransferase